MFSGGKWASCRGVCESRFQRRVPWNYINPGAYLQAGRKRAVGAAHANTAENLLSDALVLSTKGASSFVAWGNALGLEGPNPHSAESAIQFPASCFQSHA
jgi:hypothetical protein